jgi:lipopolysaccharide/colanic/teichoic acid biosynthesis glycosyltransferase
LDVSGAIVAIILGLPLLGLITLLVLIDSPGPVFFRQQRGGLAGEPFSILKFRTLTVLEDGPEVVQVHHNDPRITPIGRRLRALHLDELPQIFNVLLGDMSLVGPRPHAVVHDSYYGPRIQGYVHRYAVKPGITGWAQINGARGPTPLLSDMQTRIKFDLWYVEHACIGLDVLVLVKTPLAIIRTRFAESGNLD